MIDTGSTLGLLLKSSPDAKAKHKGSQKLIGAGFNGLIYGHTAAVDQFNIGTIEIYEESAQIIYSPWNSYASVGMDILKDYAVVLNYCKSYIGLRKV